MKPAKREEGLFERSFEEWQEDMGGAVDEWRRQCNEVWVRIRADEHYHRGRTCREVHCDRYPQPISGNTGG